MADEFAIWPRFNEALRVKIVEADDIARECRQGIYKIPVILQL
jgi:hypothetical protein